MASDLFGRLRGTALELARRSMPCVFDTWRVQILHGHTLGVSAASPGVWGVYFPGLSTTWFRAQLQAVREWYGPARAVILYPWSIAREIASQRITSSSRASRSRLRLAFGREYIATTLHELCHLALDDIDDVTTDSPMTQGGRIPDHFCGAIVQARMSDPGICTPPPGIPPWGSHDDRFVRLAVHVGWRAMRFGVDVGDVVDTSHFGLPPMSAFQEGLGREPERMIEASIEEILATPAPAAFTALWRSATEEQAAAKVA